MGQEYNSWGLRKQINTVLAFVLASIGTLVLAYFMGRVTGFTFLRWVSIFGTVGSVGLSAVLAYLYLDMRDIQENQQELMRLEYNPEVRMGITFGHNGIPLIVIKNVGRSAAVDVEVKTEIGEYSQKRRMPFLSAGNSFEYPMVTEEADLDRNEIEKRIEMDDESGNPHLTKLQNKLTCHVSCRDIVGSSHTLFRVFDVKYEFSNISDVKTKTEIDSLEEVSECLERIGSELDEMNSDLF